jgi:hypothetical protein
MFRTIIALLIALVAAVLIGAFQIVGLGADAAIALFTTGDVQTNLMTTGGAIFNGLLRPYTSAIGGGYAPLVALGVAGFVSGLISKSGVRMLFVSLISMVLFFLGFWILYLSGGVTDFSAMFGQVQLMAIDLGVAFGLLFVPGISGASLTAEDY